MPQGHEFVDTKQGPRRLLVEYDDERYPRDMKFDWMIEFRPIPPDKRTELETKNLYRLFKEVGASNEMDFQVKFLPQQLKMRNAQYVEGVIKMGFIGLDTRRIGWAWFHGTVDQMVEAWARQPASQIQRGQATRMFASLPNPIMPVNWTEPTGDQCWYPGS